MDMQEANPAPKQIFKNQFYFPHDAMKILVKRHYRSIDPNHWIS